MAQLTADCTGDKPFVSKSGKACIKRHPSCYSSVKKTTTKKEREPVVINDAHCAKNKWNQYYNPVTMRCEAMPGASVPEGYHRTNKNQIKKTKKRNGTTTRLTDEERAQKNAQRVLNMAKGRAAKYAEQMTGRSPYVDYDEVEGLRIEKSCLIKQRKRYNEKKNECCDKGQKYSKLYERCYTPNKKPKK